MESVERRFTKKYELLQQQLLERLEQQEKKHKEDKKGLQQQLVQQKKKHEEDTKKLLQKFVQQEKHKEVKELEQQLQLAQQEKKHKEDMKLLYKLLQQEEEYEKQGNKKWIYVVLVVVFICGAGLGLLALVQQQELVRAQLTGTECYKYMLQFRLGLGHYDYIDDWYNYN